LICGAVSVHPRATQLDGCQISTFLYNEFNLGRDDVESIAVWINENGWEKVLLQTGTCHLGDTEALFAKLKEG
jgi:hypothetical protein